MLKLLNLIFFFSGFASLIYQVVWQRLLTLYFGLGAVSTALIVSVYMLGLGIGALVGGIVSEKIKDRFTLYFWIEGGISIFGIASIPLLKMIGDHTAGCNYFFTFVAIFLFLCIPTFLMGITLPLLTKIYNRYFENFFETVSLLYFINTLGAAVGCIFASYILISFWGLDSAIYFAATVNFLLAILIYVTKTFPPPIPLSTNAETPALAPFNSSGQWVLSLVFITGFLAIGYEIIWIRLNCVLIKDSPYAFSTILFVYLLGSALGSLAANRHIKRFPMTNVQNSFFLMQFFIAASVLITTLGFYALAKYTPFGLLVEVSFINDLHPLPFVPVSTTPHVSKMFNFFSSLFVMTDIVFWPLIFILLPTFFMGASFPFIARIALIERHREAKTVGTVYFFNVIGNMLGGLATGFILLPWLGTERTLLFFTAVGASFGFLIKAPGNKHSSPLLTVSSLGMLLIALMLFPIAKGSLYELMHSFPDKEKFTIYFEEGLEGISLIGVHGEFITNYINGVSHGGRPGYHFYHKTIEALSYTPHPRQVLIIGVGTGSVLEMAENSMDVEKLTLVEIHSPLIKNLKKIPELNRILANPKVELIIDDGRRFLLSTTQKFDLILMTPARSTSAYTNNLSSFEFFNLVKQHLTPDGVLMTWTDQIKVIPKTLVSVFEYVRVYLSFCLASNEPLVRNNERWVQLYQTLSEFQRQRVLACYQSRAIYSSGMYLGDQISLAEPMKTRSINYDLKPICEYYLNLNRWFKRVNSSLKK